MRRALEDLGLHRYKDPPSENDIYNYVKLKQKLDIPIMATELPPAGFDSCAIWITERATDMLRDDVAMKGGITAMIKTAHLAEAFNLNYEIHHGGNSANNFAGLQVAMAIPNCGYFEVLLPEKSHRYGLVRDIEVRLAAGQLLPAKTDFSSAIALLRMNGGRSPSVSACTGMRNASRENSRACALAPVAGVHGIAPVWLQ